MILGGIEPDTVVVTGAGNLSCKYIIHFDAQTARGKWKDTIKRCLQMAAMMEMRTLSFPALGTGKAIYVSPLVENDKSHGAAPVEY